VDGEGESASGGDPGDDWDDEVERDRMLGWISPDDRLWRHPSESGPSASGLPTLVSGKDRPEGRSRSGPWIVGGTTACIVLALVAAGLVMATTATSDRDDPSTTPGIASLTAAPTTEPGTRQAVGMTAVTAMVSSVRPSTVVIQVERTSGTSTNVGLVAESGGIIVTTSAAVSGAKAVTVVEPGGSRQVAQLIGLDAVSGLAVLRIGDDLPAATFDKGDPTAGGGAIAMALEPARRSGASPSPVVYDGTVLTAGRAVGADPATTVFAATAVEAPLSHDDLGCPLLDSQGRVSGLLEKTVETGGSTMSVFLPAELVLGVANQLVASGAVIHGRLGVHTSDAASTTTTSTDDPNSSTAPATGAEVDSVDPGSPAAIGALQPGDVITAIDGYPVQSSAELETRLYPDRPGTPLVVSFTRGGAAMTTAVALDNADPDAPGVHPSP
jgi:putative serine protease PepD